LERMIECKPAILALWSVVGYQSAKHLRKR